MVMYMCCRINDLRNKQVVCVKNGCVLGYISDVEISTTDGRLVSIVIFGRNRLFGLFGRDEDIIIPWDEISVIGHETVLVNTDPEPYLRLLKRGRYTV